MAMMNEFQKNMKGTHAKGGYRLHIHRHNRKGLEGIKRPRSNDSALSRYHTWIYIYADLFSIKGGTNMQLEHREKRSYILENSGQVVIGRSSPD